MSLQPLGLKPLRRFLEQFHPAAMTLGPAHPTVVSIGWRHLFWAQETAGLSNGSKKSTAPEPASRQPLLRQPIRKFATESRAGANVGSETPIATRALILQAPAIRVRAPQPLGLSLRAHSLRPFAAHNCRNEPHVQSKPRVLTYRAVPSAQIHALLRQTLCTS